MKKKEKQFLVFSELNQAKKKQAKVLIILLCFFSLLSCSKQNSESISLTTSKNIWCTLPIIAKQKGFYKEEGLDVKINYVQTAKMSTDALVSGSSDFSMVVEVNIAYLGFTGNTNVDVLATVVEAYDGAIVAQRSSGIENPIDLKGKTVGILQGTTSQIFADRFFQKHNIDSVQVVNLQPVSIQTSIIGKEIDAGSIWQPFIYNIYTSLGDDAIVFNDPEAYTGYMNLAVREDWGKENEEEVKSFLKSLKKAEDFVKTHPDSAQMIMAKEINLDLETVKNIWDEYDFTLYFDSEGLLEVIKREGQWIKETQQGFSNKEAPDYQPYVDSKVFSELQSSNNP